jgi:CRP-like cAMP-binding protein
VGKPANSEFDPLAFLAKVGAGKTILKFEKNQHVFEQGDVADTVFARLLLLLAHFGKEGSPQPILVDISQETLAEMIGTTRSRVSHFMNKFRKLGLISYNGKIEVHNSLLNAVLHEKPEIERDEPTSKDAAP